MGSHKHSQYLVKTSEIIPTGKSILEILKNGLKYTSTEDSLSKQALIGLYGKGPKPLSCNSKNIPSQVMVSLSPCISCGLLYHLLFIERHTNYCDIELADLIYLVSCTLTHGWCIPVPSKSQPWRVCNATQRRIKCCKHAFGTCPGS